MRTRRIEAEDGLFDLSKNIEQDVKPWVQSGALHFKLGDRHNPGDVKTFLTVADAVNYAKEELENFVDRYSTVWLNQRTPDPSIRLEDCFGQARICPNRVNNDKSGVLWWMALRETVTELGSLERRLVKLITVTKVRVEGDRRDDQIAPQNGLLA